MKTTIRKILREFNIEDLSSYPYKDGELVLEYTDGYDDPRYVIYYETDDTSTIVAELDARFFDVQMAESILNYVRTK